MAEKEPFKVAIPAGVLTDLRSRLKKTRWAGDFGNEQWAYGTHFETLKELVDYWQNGFDWRRQEREINRFSHYKTTIEGIPIHFIHQPGKGPRPIPLILSHGWPWTFWDLNKVIRPLSDPASFGGSPEDAFDVVVPSLPGYGFSTPLTATGINYWRTADLWVELMRGVLGYERFAAQGGDWGAMITAQLGHKYADRMIGIHVTMVGGLSLTGGNGPKPEDYAPEEAGWGERTANFFRAEGGYFHLQTTKPQTLAYGLNDSPAGLCSWILEKRRTWSDCDGQVERRFTRDELLTTMMICWASQSFGTSARYYYEAIHNPWRPSHEGGRLVEVPTAVAVFPREVILMPRRWVERHYNVQRWTVFPSGGHFAPMEEPERLVEDIRAFFRTLRTEK
jgi:pimeloyl-ACP methyl ester carboxylesterase